MKTIKEIGQKAYGVSLEYNGVKDDADLARQYAEFGATWQKTIDIDKACEIYEKELRQMKRILNEVKEGSGKLISVGGSLVQFRKAMEEQI